MKLVKCPRCDLNYIQETEKLCKVCQREMKGEQTSEEMEMCSVCNAAPALPGHDVCLGCPLARAALQQIVDNRYDTEMLAQGISAVVKYGVAFSGKRVEIAVG